MASSLSSSLPLAPVLLSFIYVGIYWNKQQHVKHPSAIGTFS
jgi:hypothetical protein